MVLVGLVLAVAGTWSGSARPLRQGGEGIIGPDRAHWEATVTARRLKGTTMRIRTIAAGAAALLTLALAGCGGDESAQDTAQQAADEYCSAIEQLRAQVEDFTASVSDNPSVGELRDQRDQVADAFAEVTQAAEGRDQAVADAVAEAQQNFRDALGDIDAETLLNDATDQYEQASADYEETLSGIEADAGC